MRSYIKTTIQYIFAMTNRYFQVFNLTTGRWVKYDRVEARITDCKKTKGKYEGVPVYRYKKKRER
jgi:hypothetical protein